MGRRSKKKDQDVIRVQMGVEGAACGRKGKAGGEAKTKPKECKQVG